MNPIKALRTLAVATLAGFALAGAMAPAEATITATFSAGSCGGLTSANFSTGGPAVTVSLCVSTTTEKLCGNTLKIQSASAAENNAFNITARTNGPNYPDPNNVAIGFPIGITNPANPADMGGTNAGVPQAAGASQLLATFTLAPQASATNLSYVISTTADTIVSVDSGTNDCSAASDTPIPTSFTLNLVPPGATPAFSSANTTTFTVGQFGTFNVTATGSPAPNITFTGSVPGGVSFAGGVLSGTPSLGTVGNYTINFTAANGNLPNATQAFTLVVAKQTQTINFPPLASPQTFSATPVPLAATSTAGLGVTFSSTTPGVCSVSGTNATMLTAGVCTVAANQAGTANVAAAPTATQSFTITAVAPGAPTIGSGTPGNLQATIGFAPPLSTGGSPITGYTATCNPGGFTGAATSSPITVTALTNGTTYTCSVTATNIIGTGPASGNVSVTPSPVPVPPLITSANTTTFAVNVAGNFTITATGNPIPVISFAGTLPAGVSLSPAGVLAGTATVGGSFPITVTASNGNLPNATQAFTLVVANATQTITFPNPGPQNFSATPLALTATSSSGLAVSYISATPTVCSISGSNVIMITAGTCTLNANQAGDASFGPAPQMTQSFAITATAPGAPTLNAVFPANNALILSFLPPASTGGAPLTYSGLCNPGGFTGSATTTSLTVLGLTNGTTYTCTVTASNSVGPGPASNAISGVPSQTALLQITSGPPPNGVVGVPYSHVFVATLVGANFTLSAGSLPPGLVLDTFGQLTGIPTAAGSYSGTVTADAGANANLPAKQDFTITILPATYQGAWYGGPTQNGWGISLIEHGDRLVAGWYFYGNNHAPTWLIMPGCTWTIASNIPPVRSQCTGNLYQSTGAPLTNYSIFPFKQQQVGLIAFTFIEGNPNGQMDYVVNGISGTNTISRLNFGSGSAPSSVNYTDVWWGGSSESGWGLALIQDRGTLGAAWYTYDQSGLPVWMILGQGSWTSATAYTARLIRATGSPMIGFPYGPGAFAPQDVGTVTFTFIDANTALMQYSVDGVLQGKIITRFSF